MEWNLDQLRQFVATADHGSFSSAARHLGKAQSAVSTAIGLLEADLGVALFDRSRRNAQLSPAGETLLLEARELLRQADGLAQRAQALAAGGEARLSLAMDEALPYQPISTLMREMSSRFPWLELTLLNGTATEVADYVRAHKASVAFHFDRGPAASCFEQRHIGSVAQGVYVAMGHPLASGDDVGRRELARHRQLLLHAEDVREVIYSPRVWRSDSFYSIAEMVSDNLGWAVLPVNIAHYDVYRATLQAVPCPSLALPPLSVRMLWLQGKDPGETASWVQTRLAELLQVSLEA